MNDKHTRIGLIGYGQIGIAVHEMINNDPSNGMEVVFVHDMDSSRYQDAPDELVLETLDDFESKKPDLVVEMAHPSVTQNLSLIHI